MSFDKKAIIESSIIINKVKEIQAVLALSYSPCCFVSKKQIGMTLKEILHNYESLDIHYTSPFKGAFEVEIRSKNATTTCHLVNNICVESYIFYDEDFTFYISEFPFNTLPN